MRFHSAIAASAAGILLTIIPTANAAENAAAPECCNLPSAIEAALKHTPGYALEAELEREKGKHVYEIDVLHDGEITEVKVDASTGKVIKAETEELKHRIKELVTPEKKFEALKQAKISLSEAITKAEAEMKGTALEAEFQWHRGSYTYEVELEAEEDRFDVFVDPSSGVVQKR